MGESGQSAEKKAGEFEVYRLKARIPLTDGSVKIVQGVRDVFEIKDTPEGDEAALDETEAKLVIIGRDIGGLDLEDSYFSSMSA